MARGVASRKRELDLLTEELLALADRGLIAVWIVVARRSQAMFALSLRIAMNYGDMLGVVPLVVFQVDVAVTQDEGSRREVPNIRRQVERKVLEEHAILFRLRRLSGDVPKLGANPPQRLDGDELVAAIG